MLYKNWKIFLVITLLLLSLLSSTVVFAAVTMSQVKTGTFVKNSNGWFYSGQVWFYQGAYYLYTSETASAGTGGGGTLIENLYKSDIKGTMGDKVSSGSLSPSGMTSGDTTVKETSAPVAKNATPTATSAPLYWVPNVGIGKFVQGKAIQVGAGANILGDYISIWYTFLVGVAGLLAMVMIVMGGITWLTSGGSSGTIGDAKKTISSALIGLTLALLSYVLLQVINPNLTTIKMPDMTNVEFEGDYQIANVDMADELSFNATGHGSADLSTLGADMKVKNQKLLDDFKSKNPNGTPPEVNSTSRPGRPDLHGVNRAVDYNDNSAEFNAYMNSLINSSSAKPTSYKFGNSPGYYVTFPDGSRGRVSNEVTHWHVDDCKEGEIPFPGRKPC